MLGLILNLMLVPDIKKNKSYGEYFPTDIQKDTRVLSGSNWTHEWNQGETITASICVFPAHF